MAIDYYLPAQLPPPMAVADISPAAAEAISAFHQSAASLPPHTSAGQVNSLDEMRTAALVELGDEFFAALADEEIELRGTLGEEIAALISGWQRLEAIRALRAWRNQPTKYSTQDIPVMTIGTGNGYTKTVRAREALRALIDAVKGGV
jgi:hypothetical protein